MKNRYKIPERSLSGVFALFLALSTVIAGCAMGTALKTESAGPATPEGQYRLYLYGCHYADDLENMALIVREPSPYTFDLYAPETSYQVVPPQPFDRAVEQADRFLRCGMRTVTGTLLRRVIDPAGAAAGYEMLPHYAWYELGAEEAVNVNYSLKNSVITVYITLVPELEMREHFPDIPGSSGAN